ncbi:hypothetical protein Aperf_G00000037886 [Anoplocephala perfoliata]
MERFDRLLEEQQKAITQTDESIFKLRKFITEYEQLKDRLSEISKCFSKKALIPFSPKALVPARFVHTNEVLIYLGGHYGHFCEVSTHQSLFIIDKRIERIQQNIKSLEDQRKLLADREGFTQKLVSGEQPQSLSTDIGDDKGLEIREEFDPEKEEEWLAKHKENVRRERAQERMTPESTLRRVHFQDELSEESDSSDSSFIPDIVFRHSDNQSTHPSPNFTDWSNASPADVVAYIQRKNSSKEHIGILKKSKSGNPHPLSSNRVIDHAPSSSTVRNPLNDVPRSSVLHNPFNQVVERNVLRQSASEHLDEVPPKPFSTVTERNINDPEPTSITTKRPMSRFRLQKMSQ